MSEATCPVGPDSCDGRTYNRLNADYEPMHALCRFFLNNSGPTHERGDRPMLPFLVNMSRQLPTLLVGVVEGAPARRHLPGAAGEGPTWTKHPASTSI